MAEDVKRVRRQGRHLYDPALVARLLAERDQSGETYKALSTRSGIPEATLGWHGRRRRGSPGSKFVEFVVNRAERDGAAAQEIPDLRVAVRPGDVVHEVIVPRGFDADELRRLITALVRGC